MHNYSNIPQCRLLRRSVVHSRPGRRSGDREVGKAAKGRDGLTRLTGSQLAAALNSDKCAEMDCFAFILLRGPTNMHIDGLVSTS